MTTHDYYQSRAAPDWELVERREPVVRGGPDDGPLSGDELEQLASTGYLIKPSLLSEAEVQHLLDESHRLADDPRLAESDEVISEPDSDRLRSIFRVHDDGGVFATVARDERLAGTARQIVGGDVYVHQSRINFKRGFDGREFYWHSDFETWHIEDGMPGMRAVSASLLLTENSEVNGPLMLIPGSHRWFVRCVGETPAEHYRQSLKRQEYGVPDRDALRRLVEDGGIVTATGPPGTVVFFDCNTMHGSSGNLSPFPRHNVFLVFNSVENAVVSPFGGTPPRPEFLASRRNVSPLV